MKCPYCAEEIVDTAMICRHCGRDFTFVRPLWDKIHELERGLASIHDSLRRLSDQRLPIVGTLNDSRGRIFSVSLAVVTLASTGSIAFYSMFRHAGNPIILCLSIAFPAVGGFAEGLLLRGRYLKLYFACGATIGLADFTGTLLISTGILWPLPPDWMQGALFFPGVQMLLVVSSALFGDWLTSHVLFRAPSAYGTDLAAAVAKFGSGTHSDLAKDVEFWKGVINTLAPVLTLAGTIIAAYLTYLGALAKK